jgi:hypothetical protein
MSSTIKNVEQLNTAVKELHKSACALLYEVEDLVKAREVLGLTRDVHTHCEKSLTTATASAKIVTDELRSTLPA